MKLRNYLSTYKIKITDFAQAVGCHHSHISLILRGARRPSPDLALKIERATGGQVTRDELLFPQLHEGRSKKCT